MRRGIIYITVLVAWLFGPWTDHGAALRITMLDVGQGDGLVIQTPSGRTALIDGGPDSQVIHQLDAVLPYWDRTIDALLPSHTDTDHLGGLVSVLDRYRVDTVFITPYAPDTSTYHAFSEQLKKEGANTRRLTQGDVVSLDREVTLHSVWPRGDTDWQAVEDANAISQVVRLSYGSFDLLFTGDISSKEASVILAQGLLSGVEVLKVPHHGSRFGLTPALARIWQPQVALISVGRKNTYGHPAPSVLQQLSDVQARVYRTDLHGRVTITVDGSGWSVTTQH